MTVKNKSNNEVFEVIAENDFSVTLKRCSDEKVFEIKRTEFSSNFSIFEDKGKITFLNTVDSKEVVEKLNPKRGAINGDGAC